MTTPLPITRIHTLPTSPSDPLTPFLLGKYVSLRLNALLTSPSSFASTHALESMHPYSYWSTRLSSPTTTILVAVSYPPYTPPYLQTLDRGDFIGMTTLLGPTPSSTYSIPLSGFLPLPDSQETKWHMCAVYLDPLYRGQGIGKLLVNFAVQFAVARSQGEGRG
ncbi:hypothetical protein GLAREA_06450 [Glarea lozoyensis ATCC 20868]|uniref:N-acetyltransferase domain-containing protein n=1 Tax=Glarea lozoyensis (strain ATCC 20868 / MF5171) TaxID=1116229 RepID=S3D4R7_GLAL2|nr:uncharacterized protein GLAREA_06450 [Glarea lozoyensis ATCC 20868]EPE33437.1 hypothetical protein GLAREA_06450 [Glarea lozoyensis ATCC 20868]